MYTYIYTYIHVYMYHYVRVDTVKCVYAFLAFIAIFAAFFCPGPLEVFKMALGTDGTFALTRTYTKCGENFLCVCGK